MPVLRLAPDGAPEIGAPPAERLIDGAPAFRTWNRVERDGLYAGIWESTPGAWRVVYDEWEYCHILSGHSVLTADDGEVTVLRAGDSIVIEPGFRGTWRVVETTRKDYVIRL